MSCFPMCVELAGKRMILVGKGPQTEKKRETLLPFGAEIYWVDMLTAEDLEPRPAFVVVGDLTDEQARHCSALCMERGIPVNVVDQPQLCSFFFPALIHRGELCVAVSTGGKSPAAAAWLRGEVEALLPEETEQILDWLAHIRQTLRASCSGTEYRPALKELTARAFGLGRALNEAEYAAVLEKYRLT